MPAWLCRAAGSNRSKTSARNSTPWAPPAAARPPFCSRPRSTVTPERSSSWCADMPARPMGACGLTGILVSHPGWVDSGEAILLFQAALKRHRLLPHVPTLPELALSDEGREVLRAAASTGEIGRSILTTPE